MIKTGKHADKTIITFILIYFVLNMFLLDSFPFVHADEAWLASLTRAVINEKSFAAVEDFFILTKRHPHALKSVFHMMQIPFVAFSFSVISVRILSLIFSSANLFFFYMILKKNIRNRKIILFTLILLAADIQYLYISRFARQEIIILTLLTTVLYLLNSHLTLKRTATAALLTGIAVGIHPNSFIIFTASVFFISGKMLVKRKDFRKNIKALVLYISVTSAFALVFVVLSIVMDSDFFHNYLQFGSRHGVTDIFIVKLLKLKKFYFKIFNRISGTYYLPDVCLQLFVFLFFSIVTFISSIFSKHMFRTAFPVLMFAAGINTGFILIGKYSPPSFSFIFPAGWLIAALGADSLSGKGKNIKTSVLILLAVILGFNLHNTYSEVLKWKSSSYKSYMKDISHMITEKGRVFGSINTSFYMDYRQLASYNDMEMFEKSGISFEEYIVKNRIRYIIYTDELDIIYRERPLWNDLYGNIYPHYREIKEFIENRCVRTGEVLDETYPVRIVDFIGRKKYSAAVFKVEGFKKHQGIQ